MSVRITLTFKTADELARFLEARMAAPNELRPLARNERKVAVSDQMSPRCSCKPLRDRGLWRTWTAEGLWSARLPAQELLVTCRRCRASWIWGRR